MEQQQFLDFIIKQCQPMYSQKQEDRKLIQICLKELQYFIQSTQFLIQQLYEDLTTIEKNYSLDEIEEIINITNNNHFPLENKQIEIIINLNNYNKKYEYNLSSEELRQLKAIRKQFQDIKCLDNQIIQPNAQLVYKSHFEHTQDSIIYTSQISYDEKYLVFGGSDGKIKVYEIIAKQLIKSIQIDNSVAICMFTKESKYLICGDSNGYLYCFDVNNIFNQQYKNKIHSDLIRYILPINNDQIITCSRDQSIIITNIKQKIQQLLIKNAHKDYIQTIDYDQLNDVIISGSKDKSIKFFNRKNGLMQFEQQDIHQQAVWQIQLISEKKQNSLLSSDIQNLILWQIDYHKKQLNKIKVLNQEHYSFTSVGNNNRIILICDKVIQIVDKNLNQMQVINQNVYLKSFYVLTRQLNSMNYVIITNGNYNLSKIYVLKRT